MKFFVRKTALLFYFLLFISSTSHSQSWDKIIKAVANDRENMNYYGNAVSISGNYAVVGAILEREDENGNYTYPDAGAAYVLFNDGKSWKQIKKIVAPIRDFNDDFGISVAISGDNIVVGAQQEEQDASESNTIAKAGAAYIFSRNQGGTNMWGLVKKITAPNRSADAYFGKSVSISGDYIIVGAYMESMTGNNGMNNSGAAYVFRKDQGGANNWGAIKNLVASDRSGSDNFGMSVCITDNYAIVGAYQESRDGAPFATGAAYVFKKSQGGTDGWGEVKKLIAPVREAYDYFGYSVSITDEFAIVGAIGEDESESETNTLNNSGSAYLFKNNFSGADSWGMIKKLTAGNREAGDSFGTAVAISGNIAVVGASTENHDAEENNSVENAGGAYVFSRNVGGTDMWGKMKKIVAPVRATDANFGIAVAANGQNVLIGANLEDADASDNNNMLNAGAVYFVTSTTPLPVRLSIFTATKNENQTSLQWTTANESNSGYFEVQRSADGKKWTVVDKVTAAKESNISQEYTAWDKKPLEGENLYRLKMVDLDETFAYSSIKSVFFSNSGDVSFYPNPVSDKLYMAASQVDKIGSVKLVSATGQVVLQSAKIKDGLSVQNLTPGLYVMQITQTDGQSKYSKVVVIR